MKITPGQIRLFAPEAEFPVSRETLLCDCGNPLAEISYLTDEDKDYLYAEQVWYCPGCQYAEWGKKMKTKKKHPNDYF